MNSLIGDSLSILLQISITQIPISGCVSRKIVVGSPMQQTLLNLGHIQQFMQQLMQIYLLYLFNNRVRGKQFKVGVWLLFYNKIVNGSLENAILPADLYLWNYVTFEKVALLSLLCICLTFFYHRLEF